MTNWATVKSYGQSDHSSKWSINGGQKHHRHLKIDGNSLRNDPDDPLGEAFDGLKSGPEIRSPIFIARPLHWTPGVVRKIFIISARNERVKIVGHEFLDGFRSK